MHVHSHGLKLVHVYITFYVYSLKEHDDHFGGAAIAKIILGGGHPVIICTALVDPTCKPKHFQWPVPQCFLSSF